MATQRYFHLHLVSDATGETLITVGRAAAAQYKHTHSIEHIHSLVRTQAQVERALREIEQAPGIVLYTLVDATLAATLEAGLPQPRHPLRLGARSGARRLPVLSRHALGRPRRRAARARRRLFPPHRCAEFLARA